MKLNIAKGLSLPLETVTQTIAILAIKRSGKSFAAKRLAEQLFKASLQVVGVDPKGDWWGLRYGADGRSPGLGFLILGGEHGDLPLEVGSGELVARLVVEERVSVILDLSLFRKHEVATFMAAFGEALYRLKAQERFRTPVMVIVDEADAVAPQKPQENEARMLGAWQDIVRRGGQRGIGSTFVTQRSAVLNKDLLTQAQVLIALRTISPQDRKALDAWIEVHGTPEQRETLMASIPSLPRGDAWVWSPGWPTDEGIFQRVHVLPIETFDSGATPKPGEKRIVPKHKADVDLEALRRQMADTVERAKANDPAALRRRIAELERELARKPAAAPPAPARVERVEVAVVKARELQHLSRVVERMGDVADNLAAGAGALREIAGAVVEAVQRTSAPAPVPPRAAPPTLARRVTPAPAPARPGANGAGESAEVRKGERRILTAIAQHGEGVTREQLSVLTGYKRSSRDTYLQRLFAAGLIAGHGDRIHAVPPGIEALGPGFEPLPTGQALLDHWRQRLPAGERAILEVLIQAYPEPAHRDRISELVPQYQRSSRDTYLQRLRARQLVTETGRGQVRASDTLFT